MSELHITAGQLTGMVYAKFEPPLSDERLKRIQDSDVLVGVERGETNYRNRVIRFRPDWGDFSESLTLEAKDRVLKMGELLVSEEDDLTVVTEEALLEGRDWHFDIPVDTALITREAVDRELERTRLNQSAALTFTNMMGGMGGVLLARGGDMIDRIMEADPDDNLSGLRRVAEDMVWGPFLHEISGGEAEANLAIVSPEAARHWLLAQKRAIELPTGELRILDIDGRIADKNTDHMTLAGLWIAQQEDSVDFATAYRAMNPASSLTDDKLAQAGVLMSTYYLESQQPPRF